MTRTQNKQRVKYKFAQLLDRFHLRPAELGRLTPRQIDDLYFHARDKDTGEISKPVVEPRARTPEEEIMVELVTLESARATGLITAENYETCKARLLEKKKGLNGRTEGQPG